MLGPYQRAKLTIKRAIKRKRPLSGVPVLGSKRFLFIGGLHRSGTSILHRLLREHPATTGFSDTGVFQDEGQHLQTVFPAAFRLGGAGRFAFNPNAHLTETSDLAVDANRGKLLREWGAYYDLSKDVLLEKSPTNVIRSRFFQALFPEARFAFIVRHPIVVSIATRKWSRTSVAELMFHWRVAHRLMIEDLHFLRNYVVVRYEDLVASPQVELGRVYDLVGIDRREPLEKVENHNGHYFDAWKRDYRGDHRLAELTLGDDADLLRRFGYTLAEPYVGDMITSS